MSSLGNDIIQLEILPRLSVKSVVRFKCVSKSYKTLISSQEFMQLYRRHNSHSSDDLLVMPKDGSIICYDLYSSTPTATFTFPEAPLGIIGSCNGVLYTRYGFRRINLSSYTMHEALFNPKSQIFLDYDMPLEDVDCNYALAFDPVSLNFKIMGLTDHYNEEGRTRITKVYNVNTNSCTIIDTEFLTDSLLALRSYTIVVINNYLVHWTYWTPPVRIRCFDVCKMNWTDDVLLPHHHYNPTHGIFIRYIGALDGRLCSTFENEVESCFSVWVMTEYGVQDSWLKLFSIPFCDYLPYGMIPIASRSGSAEVLIRDSFRRKCYWYNRINGGMSESKFDDVPTHMCSRSMGELPGGRLLDDH